MLAIEGCSLEAMRQAVHRLIRGEVDEHDGKYVPSTAILARAVKYEDFRITAELEHSMRQLAKPVPEPVIELTEEEMAHRRAQVARILRGLHLKGFDEAAA